MKFLIVFDEESRPETIATINDTKFEEVIARFKLENINADFCITENESYVGLLLDAMADKENSKRRVEEVLTEMKIKILKEEL